MPKQVSRPRRRAAAIIDAAAQVFAARGFHGASTQDIADVLGIRQASLYYYFPSKDVALEQVCLRGVEGFLEAAVAISGTTETSRRKIERIVAAHLTPLETRRAYVQTFLKERQHLPAASRRRIGRLSRAYEKLIEDVLKAGIGRGEFRRDMNCRLATLALLGMLNAAVAWFGKERSVTVTRIATEFGRLFLSGASRNAAGASRAG